MSALLNHEENLAFLREGKGGLTLGGSYYGTEEQYRQAHGLDLETTGLDSPEADASAESLDSAESKPSHETTIPLLSGVAVLCAPGAPVPFSEGPKWLASGDFKCFLELGEEDNTGLYRELLVGPFRAYDNDNDHELPPGNFLTDPEWDFVVGEPRNQVLQLVQEIGFDPYADRPDESKPRGETWLAERAHWESETAKWEAEFVKLKAQLDAATAPAPSALPANALELIQAAGGLSKAKAEAVLAALQAPTTEAVPQ